MTAKHPIVIQRNKSANLVAGEHKKIQDNQNKATEKARRKVAALVAKANERLRFEALSPGSKQAEAVAKARAK